MCHWFANDCGDVRLRFGRKLLGPVAFAKATVPGQKVTLRAQVDDCRSRPIEISAHVVTQQVVKLTVWIVGNKDGTYYASDAANVSNLIVGVNKIYEQIGVSFYVDSISYTNSEEWLDISSNSGCDAIKRRRLTDITQNSGGLELYFIDKVSPIALGNHDRYGIVLSTNVTAKIISHEIGHAFGSSDVYPTRRVGGAAPLPDSSVCEARAPGDWSNGEGCRYYMPGLTQKDLIGRLLMCGFGYPDAIDLSTGSIYGYGRHSQSAGLVDTGFFSSSGRMQIIFHW